MSATEIGATVRRKEDFRFVTGKGYAQALPDGDSQATSTEQIATTAAVSKQTVYNQFGDKQRLFREIVLGVTATAEAGGALSQPAPMVHLRKANHHQKSP